MPVLSSLLGPRERMDLGLVAMAMISECPIVWVNLCVFQCVCSCAHLWQKKQLCSRSAIYFIVRAQSMKAGQGPIELVTFPVKVPEWVDCPFD